jgi:Ca2+-binding EF-hand superfamily protein
MLPDDYFTMGCYHAELVKPRSTLYWYLKLAERCRQITEQNWFGTSVLLTIIVAGINVGAQTYEDDMSPNLLTFFTVLDMIIFIIFAYEMMVKIFAEGLRFSRYWTGPEYKWNNFDFAIVVMTFPMLESVLKGGSMVALLRLARLARLGKLIKRIPALQMIVQGLIGGISSIGYILLLLGIVFYIYAVMAVGLFGSGDPFHFADLTTSMVSLFRIATLANWGQIMFLNTFGCAEYPTYYVPPGTEGVDSIFYCTDSTSWDLAPIFFCSFVVISSFVMLSLFIGAITMSMADSMDELKANALKRKREATFEKNRRKITSMASSLVQRNKKDGMNGMRTESFSSKKLEDYVALQKRADDHLKLTELQKSHGRKNPVLSMMKGWIRSQTEMYRLNQEERDKLRMQRALVRAMGALDAAAETEVFEAEARERNAEGIYGFWKYYIKLGYKCQWLAELPMFNHTIIAAICIAGINVGVQLDAHWEEDSDEMKFLMLLDDIILGIFIFEIFVKIVAEKMQPWAYFFDGWNKFDFIIVCGSFAPGAGNTVMLVRLLRLLRVLKLVKKLPQLAVIVNALMTAMSSISYVALILILALYIFAILGMLLFKVNDPWHFKNLHLAMISLIRAATLDEWNELMYVEMYGCDVFEDVYGDFPGCDKPQAQFYVGLAFFSLFIILVAQVLLTLFIGVISTSMDESRNAQMAEFRVDEKISEVREELGLSTEQMKDFKLVFDMLDLDGGGSIDETELSLGLYLIDDENSMSEADAAAAFRKVDPKGTGSIDICGFIHFMCITPKFRLNALKKKIVRYWERGKRKKVNTFWDKVGYFVLYGAYNEEKQMQIKAALVIQLTWKSRKEQRALADIERERLKKNAAKKRRMLHRNTSILMDQNSDSDDSTDGMDAVASQRTKLRAMSAYSALLES